MGAIGLAAHLHFEDFFVSLLTVQAPYEWAWRMCPLWGWAIGMVAMMLLVLEHGEFCRRWEDALVYRRK